MATVRNRGRLPHWENDNATYFVTFRLADSLPRSVLQQIESERADIIRTAQAMKRELSAGEQRRLTARSGERIEGYLDAGAGSCHLGKPAVAREMVRVLRHFEGDRYRLFAWCVMPNHVHVVFQPLAEYTLAGIVHGWKSYTAKEANRMLRRSGTFWQREYYDHLVRGENDLCRVNPVTAGLRNWPWVSATSTI
ncbi:MAG: transposase [Candidatus Acidiferrales bacterium]